MIPDPPIMGNLCGNPKGLTSSPPRDLNTLLIEIRVPEDIDQSPWAKQFREHLTSLNQPEKEAMFDFVLVCNVLRVKESEVKQVTRSMKWRLTELNKDRRDLLCMIGQSFFSEGCDTPIPLTNKILREELCKHLSEIDSISDDDLSDVYDLVWQARCDHRVWKGGVNEAYLNFIASKPAPSISAVLLSII